MSNQNSTNHPTIKKAATHQDKPLTSDMIINNNIVPQEPNALDIPEARSSHESTSETHFGACAGDEFLKQSGDGRYVKLSSLHRPVPPNIQPNTSNFESLTNVSKRGRLTADTTPFTTLKTGIDWLTFVSDNIHSRTLDPWIKKWLGGHQLEEVKGKFYKGKFEYSPHRTTLSYGHNQNGASKVEITGTALAGMTHEKVVDMLKSLEQFEAKVTRLDLFTDCYDPDVRIVEDTIEHVENPRNTRLTHKIISSKKQGQNLGSTIYLGTNKSHKYWRIYDKGIEQGTSSNVWQRVELQCNRYNDYANEVTKELLSVDASEHPQTIRNIIFQDIWQRELPYWNLMKTRDVSIRTTRNTTDFSTWAKWISSSVLPRLRMVASELNTTLERLILHLDNIDPDHIVSVPEKYQYFLEQFQDSLLDDSNHPAINNTSHPVSDQRTAKPFRNGQIQRTVSDTGSRQKHNSKRLLLSTTVQSWEDSTHSKHLPLVDDQYLPSTPPLLNGRISL